MRIYGSSTVMSTVHSSAYRKFLKELRRARLEAGLTQAQVARALRVHQSWVSKSESGERRVDVVELGRLARVYGREVGDFL